MLFFHEDDYQEPDFSRSRVQFDVKVQRSGDGVDQVHNWKSIREKRVTLTDNNYYTSHELLEE